MVVVYVVLEQGIIYSQNNKPSTANHLSELAVPSSTFALLKRFAFLPQSDAILSFGIQRGKEIIKLKNYVGLLSLFDGTIIEILPKTTHNTLPDARIALLKLLRVSENLPFQHLTPAFLQQSPLPLWEVFVGAFLGEMEKITMRGIQRVYTSKQDIQPFVRGKWLVSKQQPLEPHWVSVVYDDFEADNLPNRLLKTCLVYLAKRSQYLPHQRRLHYLLCVWEEISISTHLTADFEQLPLNDRRFDYYQKALAWAKVLLKGQSWGSRGQWLNESLLFPAERLFEHYVIQGFKRYFADFEIKVQDQSQFLIERHENQRRFSLRPDLVLKRHHQLWVFDMKWKCLDPQLPNYGISQGDLYQLYAYGKKYNATALFLIYPAHATFQAPLPPFLYDKQMTLHVLPFEINNPWSVEIEKIRSYLGSIF
ncbi:MAG: McrC family protein [Runella sp.]